jgi:hypothetical protein
MRRAFFRLLLSIVLSASCVSLAESAQEHSGAAPGERHAIFDIGTVPTGDPDSLLGREVVAVDVRVEEVLEGGFWVTPTDGEPRTFVVPAEGSLITVRAGEVVSLHGGYAATDRERQTRFSHAVRVRLHRQAGATEPEVAGAQETHLASGIIRPLNWYSAL